MNLEMATAFAAMITAVVAVIVAIIQTNIMREEAEMEREHARLSVQPSLWVFRNTHVTADESNLSYQILNKGLGPASIEQFEVFIDGQLVKTWDEAFSTLSDGEFRTKGEEQNITAVSYSSVPPGHIIPAEAKITPINLYRHRELILLLLNSGERMEFSACFCSVYKDCWKTSSIGTRPEPVKECKTNEERYFLGNQ